MKAMAKSHSTIRYPYHLFSIAVSFFGLFLAGMFTLENQVAEDYLWRKPIIGSIFASICVLGAFATLYPRRCSRAFHLRDSNSVYPIGNGSTAHRAPFVVRGHRYDCPNYSSHVIKIGGDILCASCTGLLLGALLALPVTMTYFLGYWRIEGTVMVYLGIVGVSLGLLQFPLLKDRSSSMRLLFNLIFVLGASLVLIGIDAFVHDLASDLFIILLIPFWIYT